MPDIERNEDENDELVSNSIGISDYFKSELRGDIMSLKEPNGRYIDVAESFSPTSYQLHQVVIVRAAFLVWSIVTLIVDLYSYDEENRFLYVGYLTNQGFIFSILYQIIVFILTLRRETLTQPNPELQEGLSTPLKFIWFLYAALVPSEILITLLFWILVYEDGDQIKYRSVYTHGIIMVLLLIDGNCVARIPLRLKQILFIEIYAFLYIVWTMIHSVSKIGNGNEEGDLLYDVIDWSNKPGKTAIVSIIILLVVVPFVFVIAWTLSLIGKGFAFNGTRRHLYR